MMSAAPVMTAAVRARPSATDAVLSPVLRNDESSRHRILEAASQVFADKGFHDASIQDVVRAGDLSVGAIYTCFRSTDDLVRTS